MNKKIKQKKCKTCSVLFTPFRPLQFCCSSGCAVQYAHARRIKQDRKEELKQRQELRKEKEAIKTRGQWMKEAQAAFNKFIRERDINSPCISCGRYHQGQYHAGHYMPTSTRPSLRFNELNVHKQCSACNNHKHGNISLYRIALIKKIGLDNVEFLEGEHEPSKYTIEELKQIKQLYTKKAKELES